MARPSSAHHRRLAPGSLLAALMLAPALLVSVLFFVIPLLTVVVHSFTGTDGGVQHFTIANYLDVIGDDFYWEVMGRTLRIALLTTGCALLLGYPATLFLYFSRSGWRRVFLFIIVSPLFVSVIVRTYGWIILLSPNGALNALLPDGYRVRLMQTDIAVVIGLVHIYIPFMVLSLNAALSRIDRSLLTAAATLGAGPARIFRTIFLPLSFSGVISGCVIVFSISMTAFTTPILLGGTKNKTMAYLIYQQNLLLANWQLGSALAVILLAVTVTIVYLLTRSGDRDSAEMLPQ